MTTEQDDQKEGVAFNREEAVQLIIAAIQNKAIDLPFSRGLNTEQIRDRLKHIRDTSNYDEKTFTRSEKLLISQECAFLARRDAIYLLTLLNCLTTPLNQKEAEGIRAVMFN